ncbi:hypothetical protein [Lapillicoccus sp.]|uniref:glycoside hydrolase family 26 protein n=1 Tax=Lapillicoccus sp. TaxID=1909287 RepID=UPI0025F157D3|nr:hypothetical protein [Lapillicoccus sp.]
MVRRHTGGPVRAGGRRQGRWAATIGLVVSAMLVAACTGTTSAPKPSTTSAPAATSTASTPAGPCRLSDKAVPTCGVLWGIATRPPTVQGVETVEAAVGRPFDFVYRYHDLKAVIPDAAERAQVAAGKLLHIAIASRDFSATDRTSNGWAAVARGDFDKTLKAQASGLASLKSPFFITFEQEANQKQKVGALGTAADFIAAWRHLHQIYVAAGATNAVWVWVMTGAADNLDAAATLWPGNDVVDWISWNVYNQSGCAGNAINPGKLVSFEDKMKIFYDFVHQRGPSIGMDVTKPMMISETGSAKYATQPDLTGQWYSAIPGALERYPQIRAVGLWDSVDGTCDYEFSTLPQAAAAVGGAGRAPSVKGALTVNSAG